ncbi:MAG TPA: zf-HC2 domain-containing protein [Thermoanaerobaculia bacterium]|nr:zf-HC2 domain-containing protein [Thermoanaerobaculia bacterium]
MNCEEAIELMPWFLNDSLSAEERRAVEEHLASCERCRTARAETRSAAQIFAAHVPTADLVAYAADETPETDAAFLRQHLEACPQCSAELELARASRLLAEHEEVALMPSAASRKERPMRIWRSSALAASLVGLVAAGGWIYTAQRASSLAERLAAAPPAMRGAPEPEGTEAPAHLETAQVNTVIVDLQPVGGNVLRGAPRPSGNVVEMPASSRSATLILHAAESADRGQRDVEIADADGVLVAHAAGLVRDPDGDYTITLDRQVLHPGEYTVQLFGTESGKRVPRESYAVTVR